MLIVSLGAILNLRIGLVLIFSCSRGGEHEIVDSYAEVALKPVPDVFSERSNREVQKAFFDFLVLVDWNVTKFFPQPYG
jgi:hypothetical protein